MINTEASQALVECTKHIARWAKKGDKPLDERSPAEARAGENAWRLLNALLKFGEHVKESDHYWLLVHRAQKHNKPAREQNRLFAIAEAEDRGYMKTKLELEELVAEMLKLERDDPKALKKSGGDALEPAKKQVAKKSAVKKAPVTAVAKKVSKAPAKAATKKVAPAKKATTKKTVSTKNVTPTTKAASAKKPAVAKK